MPDDLAIDDLEVYWVDFRGDAIRHVLKAAGTPATLATASAPQLVAVDAADVYWLTANGDIGRINKSGGGMVQLATGPGCQSSYPCGEALTVDDQAVYWTEAGTPGKVLRLPKSGGAPSALDAPNVRTDSLVVDTDYIYYGAAVYDGQLHHALRRIPKLGGAEETLFVFDETFFSGLAQDAENIYVAHEAGVWKIAKNGSGGAMLASITTPHNIAVDADNAYVTHGSAVVRIPLTGDDPIPIACNQLSARSIAIDGSQVYWVDESAETINATSK